MSSADLKTIIENLKGANKVVLPITSSEFTQGTPYTPHNKHKANIILSSNHKHEGNASKVCRGRCPGDK